MSTRAYYHSVAKIHVDRNTVTRGGGKVRRLNITVDPEVYRALASKKLDLEAAAFASVPVSTVINDALRAHFRLKAA